MVKLNEAASNYESPTTKNIADLDSVQTDLELHDRVGKDKEGLEFKYKVIIINKEEYRVPGSVLANLKAILEQKADLKTFKVTKDGAGMNTRYTVIPLE